MAAYVEATSFGVLRSLELFLADLRGLQNAEFHEAIIEAEEALGHVRACRRRLPIPTPHRRVYSSPTLTFLGKVSDLTRGGAGTVDDGTGGMQNGGTP